MTDFIFRLTLALMIPLCLMAVLGVFAWLGEKWANGRWQR